MNYGMRFVTLYRRQGDKEALFSDNAKKCNDNAKRKTMEWKRLEISSRKLEISKEHFMQGWDDKGQKQ